MTSKCNTIYYIIILELHLVMDSIIFKSSIALTGVIIITTIIQLYLDKIKEQEARKRIVEGFNGNPFSLIPMVFQVLIAAIEFLGEFPQRIKYLLDSLMLIGEGTFGEIVAIAEDVPLLVTETTKMVTCSITRVSKFGSCFQWYILDLFVSFMYTITVRLIMFIVYVLTFGYVDLSAVVDNLWSLLEEVDKIVHPYIGAYHINHYPDYITSDCYSCEVVDQNAVNKVMNDLGAPVTDIVNGVITFLSVFTGTPPSLMKK